MGYTHYWRSDGAVISPDEFGKLVANFEAILAIPQHKAILAGWIGEPDTDPVCLPGHIQFNGRGEDRHETFSLASGAQSEFEFCKTARKPYDRVVTALLCLADLHFPGALAIGSDGTAEDWREGLALAQAIEPKAKIPRGIES